MRTVMIMMLLFGFCAASAHAQEPERARALPLKDEDLGRAINNLRPVIVYVVRRNGRPVTFACGEERDCLDAGFEILTLPRFDDAEGALWTRTDEGAPTATADPCDEFKTTSGGTVRRCWNN